jgi:hypothetical protein
MEDLPNLRNRFLIEAMPSTLSPLQGSLIFVNYAGGGGSETGFLLRGSLDPRIDPCYSGLVTP